jgi:hypothetical protein
MNVSMLAFEAMLVALSVVEDSFDQHGDTNRFDRELDAAYEAVAVQYETTATALRQAVNQFLNS